MVLAGLQNDLRALTYPKDILWIGADLSWLPFAYDWDTITLPDNSTAFLSSGLNLCSGFLPCSLFLVGDGRNAKAVLTGRGYLSCLASTGCSNIAVDSIAFKCTSRSSEISPFVMQGSFLQVSRSSFSDCHSDTDGGVIQSYDRAQISLQSCEFHDVYSSGFGGAIAAYGSSLLISDSTFANCSSVRGGGALWSVAFQGCYGSTQGSNTALQIWSSIFSECRTEGSGGAVLADSGDASINSEVLMVDLRFDIFRSCKAGAEGGALRAIGALIVVSVRFSEFSTCYSFASGGALSAEGSSLSLQSCSVMGNTAYGLGGGALHLDSSLFLAHNTSIANNSAPFGGGGALLWQRNVGPAVIGCEAGMQSIVGLCPWTVLVNPLECIMSTCALCSRGTYQEQNDATSCSLCPAGTYSDVTGSTDCITCPPGKISETVGANSSDVCYWCEKGTFSIVAGASVCSNCIAGKFSTTVGANCSAACSSCRRGTYSAAGASACLICNMPNVSSKHLSERDPVNASQCFLQNNTAFRKDEIESALNSIEPVGIVSAEFPVRLLKSKVMQISNPGTSNAFSANKVWGNRTIEANISGRNGGIFPGTDRLSRSSLIRPKIFFNKSKAAYKQDQNRGGGPYFSCTFEQHEALILMRNASLRKGDDFRKCLPTLLDLSGTLNLREMVRLVLDRQLSFHTAKAAKSKRDLDEGTELKYKMRRIVKTLLVTKVELFTDDCGTNNSALYGSCIASDYKRLEVSEPGSHVFAGLPLSLTVQKKDAYNHTITSDSSSLLQANLPSNDAASAFIFGSSIAKFGEGVASFSFAIIPSFTVINFQAGFVSTGCQLNLYLAGTDLQTGSSMLSDKFPVYIQQGSAVCPAGYILMFTQEGIVNGSAVCTLCKQGTYSIQPLAHLRGSIIPACIGCPAGADCTSGGADVKFDVGDWIVVNGLYVLVSCPPGYQLINSTAGTSKGVFANNLQECRACLPGAYIINPNIDECQQCPPGSSIGNAFFRYTD